MDTSLIQNLTSLKKNLDLDQKVLAKFIQKLISDSLIVRDKNKFDHFCVFYVPVDLKNKKIYLIVHKKSGLWMPPGGHIESNETPIETVKRESLEELNFQITDEPVTLFTVSIDPIANPLQLCKTHYSLWYLVNTGKQDFRYNEESLDGKWVSLKKAKQMVTFPVYKNPIASLSSYLKI